jgi:phosphatidylserine/phosphatidylglycerophosphate/cardiolipin synthase-like enzyme
MILTVRNAVIVGCLTVLFAASTAAFEPASGRGGKPVVVSATGTIQVAFTPGDDAGKLIADAINDAHRQVLAQAFSFTHHRIAEALIAARSRGVDVIVIADKEQTQKFPPT